MSDARRAWLLGTGLVVGLAFVVCMRVADAGEGAVFGPPTVILVERDPGALPSEAPGDGVVAWCPPLESRRFHESAGSEEWLGWHRAQGLAVTVGSSGLGLARIPEGRAPWTCWLEAVSVEDSPGSLVLGPGSATAHQNRVTLDRPGLTEWIEIAEDGVRQEWLVHEAPGNGQGECLRLEIAVRGSLSPRQDGEARIHFLDREMSVALRLSDLSVWDATGRRLAASFRVGEASFEILVETLEAVYPIWIDPLASVPSAILLSDQGQTGIGFTLATLSANGDSFADLVVGEPGYDEPMLSSVGRISLYLGSDLGVGSSPNWTRPGQLVNGGFGVRTATAGDTNGDSFPDLLVQQNGPAPSLFWAGRVFVLPGGPQGFGSTEIWSATGNAQGNRFGDSLSSAGDVNGDGFGDVAIAAPDEGIGGAFYVYHGSAAGPEALPSFSEASTLQTRLGFDLACAGDQNGDGYDDLLVSDFEFPNPFNPLGRVYLYHGSPSGLQTTPVGALDSPVNVALFGFAVAGDGDVNGDGFLDVGVTGLVGNSEMGSFLYLGSASGLATTPAWSGPGQVLCFGEVNGDGFADLIVANRNHAGDAGAVWCFLGGPSGLSSTAAWSDVGPSFAYQLGRSLTVGDLNGDGLDDIAVGALNRVHVYLTTPAQFRRGDANGDAAYNLADAVFTLSHLFGASATAPGCEDAADSNDDGALNIADPIHTLNALFSGGMLPSPPGPTTCGTDPTADTLGCDTATCP